MSIGEVSFSLSGWYKALCDLPFFLSNLISMYFLLWILAILDFYEFLKHLRISLVSGLSTHFLPLSRTYFPHHLPLNCLFSVNSDSSYKFQYRLCFHKKTSFERPSVPPGLVRGHVFAVPVYFMFRENEHSCYNLFQCLLLSWR